MTWEQRFGALAGLGGDEWDVAYERLELEWRAAYTLLRRDCLSRGGGGRMPGRGRSDRQ